MRKTGLRIATLVALAILSSCGRRNVPSRTATIDYDYPAKAAEVEDAEVISESKTVVVVKPESKEKRTIAKVITVNDAAAKKSVDGRLYYDVGGRRYWKNYKDGKYYLYNKDMYKNPDFKPGK